ncbi:MAG: MMPL family transporter [Planctomycetota bacterium]
MNGSAADRFAGLVTRRSRWIVLGWIVIAATARMIAPSWNSVALDGDFKYLPADRPSVAGDVLLDEALGAQRARSQMVVVMARQNDELHRSGQHDEDELVGLDLLRRLYHRLGEVCVARAMRSGQWISDESDKRVSDDPVDRGWATVAMEAYSQAIELDALFYERLGDRVPDEPVDAMHPRLAIAYWDRGQLRRQFGVDATLVADDLEAAVVLLADIHSVASPMDQRPLDEWLALLDVTSWADSVIGKRLEQPNARLVTLSLSSELAATGNIELLASLEQMLEEVRADASGYLSPTQWESIQDLQLLVTGSAAIGGQTLSAARSAITYTEWFTVGTILLILTLVYRAPLLVAVPVFSIGIAVIVATAVVTMLTDGARAGWWSGLDLRVYTTSRIFVVVILFGAGTDYCLFLISRLREEVARKSSDWQSGCQRALTGVAGAILGSAMTTIFGLGMLWFADFGKFHHTGPIIAICLLVGLCVCMTLTPALLTLLGPAVFWPSVPATQNEATRPISLVGRSRSHAGSGSRSWFWNAVAIALTRRPWVTMVAGWGLLLIPAWYGALHEDGVTHNLARQLDASATSRQGMAIIASHFGIGESSPISVLLLSSEPINDDQFAEDRQTVVKSLYEVPGVTAVRHLNDPLGDFPPDREIGLLSSDGWRRRAIQNHRLAKLYFLADSDGFENRLHRIDVIVKEDPFSLEAADRLAAINEKVAQLQRDRGESDRWQVLTTGTTPSIVDLRRVTMTDTRRIKIAVVLAVGLVLIAVLRRWVLSGYLIATVLLSYYATLGLTYGFFRWIDGDAFLGLDWKLPVFLFVILVAVGQDYNVYLVTRILEEKRRLGSLAAVRRAVARTGGIITACGLVMSATFFSMTASAWWPYLASTLGIMGADASSNGQTTLRGIVELGFALGLGVVIDTLYVRTVLVPSFVVLHDRYRRDRRARRNPGEDEAPLGPT